MSTRAQRRKARAIGTETRRLNGALAQLHSAIHYARICETLSDTADERNWAAVGRAYERASRWYDSREDTRQSPLWLYGDPS